MPKRSTKSKSKRMSLRQKYKIIRKVKEHHKKKKKEMKKAGIKPKGPKDPGLPSQWPFKEELVKEFAAHRAHILAEEKRKKDEKKQRKLDARAAAAAGSDDEMGEEGEAAQLAALANMRASAARKEEDFETRKRMRVADDFASDKDNSRKAYYREFKKVVELSDVIIQVLDARDPLACRCPDVERYIRSTNPNKRIVLLLNKMDLVPREVGERWLKYLREELPCVAFKCSTQEQGSNIGRKRMPTAKSASDGLQGSACLGADTLLALLKNYCRNAGLKTAITVGVVGLPNVGKSSLINSLKRARVAQVGNTPGMTKTLQEVHLDKNIKLLDSPGVVFADAETEAAAVLRNCVRAEKLEDPVSPIGEILKRVPAKSLMALYKIGAFKDADTFLQVIAGARGKLKKGGTPDMRAAARIVLQDWNDGRIPYYTVPPSRGNTGFESAEVVQTWSKEFNADEVFANEQSAVIAHLPSMEEDGAAGQAAAGALGPRRFFEMQSVGQARVDIASMEAEAAAGAAAADMEGSEDEDEDEDDGDAMEDDEEEYGARPAKRQGVLAKAQAAGQVAVLYGETGQYNPHAARAERKKQKKAAAAGVAPAAKGKAAGKMEEDDDEDFDFDEHASEEEDDDEEEDGSQGEGEDDDEDDDDEMEDDE